MILLCNGTREDTCEDVMAILVPFKSRSSGDAFVILTYLVTIALTGVDEGAEGCTTDPKKLTFNYKTESCRSLDCLPGCTLPGLTDPAVLLPTSRRQRNA